MIWTIGAQWLGICCLLLWGFWFCCKLRLPCGFAPITGIAFVMIELQVFGSLHLLRVGVLLTLAGAALSLAHRKPRELLGCLARSGVLAFLTGVLVLQVAYALREPRFQTWDEFSHWGIFFKSVFYDHEFSLWQSARSLAHPAYPQGLPALYALFAPLLQDYAERDVFFVVNLPLLAAGGALFEAVCPTDRRAGLWHRLCGCAAVPLLFWIFVPDTPYTTVYMDAPVGALFAAALVLVMTTKTGERMHPWAVGLLAAATATVKEIGSVFALCVLGIWFVRCLLDRAHGWRRKALAFVQAALPVGAVVVHWKITLALLHRADDQFSGMGMGYFLRCWAEARSGTDPYFYDVWAAYWAKFRTAPLLFGASTFKVGLLCVLFSLLLAAALIRRKRTAGLQMAAAPLCMIVFWPCYQGVLFYVYIGGMSPYEAMKVASYERYACCFFIGWFAVLLTELFRLLDGPGLLQTGSAVLAGAVALAGLWGFSAGLDAFSLPYEDWRDAQLANAAAIRSAIPEDAGAVWILSADEDLAYQNMWYYQYELSPLLVAIEAQSGQDGVDLGYNIAEHQVEYLVLFGASEDFRTRYAAAFSDSLAAAAGDTPAVYQVTEDAGLPGGHRMTLCTASAD